MTDKKTNNSDEPWLEWDHHGDTIIGNKAGFEHLRGAVAKTLETGSAHVICENSRLFDSDVEVELELRDERPSHEVDARDVSLWWGVLVFFAFFASLIVGAIVIVKFIATWIGNFST